MTFYFRTFNRLLRLPPRVYACLLAIFFVLSVKPISAQCDFTMPINTFDSFDLVSETSGMVDVMDNAYICSLAGATLNMNGGNAWVESGADVQCCGNSTALFVCADAKLTVNCGNHSIYAVEGSEVTVTGGSVTYLGECGAALDVQGGSVDASHENPEDVKGLNSVNVCDEVVFDFTASPATLLDLGESANLTPADFPLVLNANGVDGPYLWSTGATTGQINVFSPGVYWVEFPSHCGTARSEITLTSLGDDPSLELGETAEVCATNLPHTLFAEGFASYEWSTGETTPSIEVSAEGWYKLKAQTACGFVVDSVEVRLVHPPEEGFLGDDLEFCAVDFPMVYDSGITDYTYEWSTGENTQQANIPEPGNYQLALTNHCGTFADTLAFSMDASSYAEVSYYLCPGSEVEHESEVFTEEGVYFQETEIDGADCELLTKIEVIAVEVEDLIVEMNIEDGRYLDAFGERFWQPGTYHLTTITDEGCDQNVTLILSRIQPEDLPIYVPTAFTPDNDGFNETFHPVFGTNYRPRLTYYQFRVYNTKGMIVFESNDPHHYGWNGKSAADGRYYVHPGVYSWEIVWNTEQSQLGREKLKGAVTVLR